MDPTQHQWKAALRRLRWHLFSRELEPIRFQLLAHCRRLTGDPATAEDLHQETVLRSFAALSEFCEAPQNPKAYLFRVATNLWIDWNKKPREALLSEPALDRATQPPAVTGKEIEESLAFLERALPPTELRVFLLRNVFEYTGAETARILGASEGAVKMAACRARKRVREAAASRHQGEPDEQPGSSALGCSTR